MGKKKKILIVEDEVIEAMFMGRLLELWGFEVCETATSGDEAINAAETERPDMILMDINIHGGMDGIAVAGKISSRFGVPIIFITGYSDEETRKKARTANPAGYFVKPLDYSKLKITIESIIQTYRK